MHISPPHSTPNVAVPQLFPDDGGSTMPDLWIQGTELEDNHQAVCAGIFEMDKAIDALRKELLLAQPFGSLRIDLRWYQASRSTRRDPVPVRYVLNSPARVLQGSRRWAVIRLDRGEHRGAPLQEQLRIDGPLQTRTVEHRAAKKIATAIQALLDQRKAILTEYGILMSSLGRRLAAMKRQLALLEAATPPPANPLTFNDLMDAY